jgi:hypothetical protein
VEPTDLLAFAAAALERMGVNYAVVGSMASSFYGYGRLTTDVDIVADLRPVHLPDLLRAFPPEKFYLSEDAIRSAIARHCQFNILHPDSGLKVDVMIPDVQAYDIHRLTRKRRLKPKDGSFEAYFAAPEDVILKKIEFYKEGGSDKHLRDIAGMLKVSGNVIDRAYIEDWATKLDLTEIWHSIRDKVDPPA